MRPGRVWPVGAEQPRSVLEPWLEPRGKLAFTAELEKGEERTERMEQE